MKDTKGLSHHDKVLNQYFDKAKKKIKTEKTLESLMGRGSGSKRSHHCDLGSDEEDDMDDADEVNSFRTAGGVFMVRGAYGLANSMFAPRIENRTLGFDLARTPPQTKRKTSVTCKLCASKARE